MSVYAKMEESMRNKDAQGFLDLLDDGFVFVSHQSGRQMNKSEMSGMMKDMVARGEMNITNSRCIYENPEILVEHSVMDFPDGSREAVMAVHTLRNGRITRTETGATPLKK